MSFDEVIILSNAGVSLKILSSSPLIATGELLCIVLDGKGNVEVVN